jgi:hypothetical protein
MRWMGLDDVNEAGQLSRGSDDRGLSRLYWPSRMLLNVTE